MLAYAGAGRAHLHRLPRQRRRPPGVPRRHARRRSTSCPTRPPATPSTRAATRRPGLTFEQGRELLRDRPAAPSSRKVDESLRRHFHVLRRLTATGARFWDYGNSFMKAVFDAGVHGDRAQRRGHQRRLHLALLRRGHHGAAVLRLRLRAVPLGLPVRQRRGPATGPTTPPWPASTPTRRGQDRDNYDWIRDAEKNRLVVGTQARILYADAEGRVRIALAFNDMVRRGEIGPVIIGRDHHDVSGTDSPFRETANIYDGSSLTSDMAHQCFAGNIARGMTYVVLSNGGGVGIGKCDQRRQRHPPRRLRAHRRGPRLGPRLGRHRRRRPPRLGAQPQRHGDGHGLERAAGRPRPHHRARGGRQRPGGSRRDPCAGQTALTRRIFPALDFGQARSRTGRSNRGNRLATLAGCSTLK